MHCSHVTAVLHVEININKYDGICQDGIHLSVKPSNCDFFDHFFYILKLKTSYKYLKKSSPYLWYVASILKYVYNVTTH